MHCASLLRIFSGVISARIKKWQLFLHGWTSPRALCWWRLSWVNVTLLLALELFFTLVPGLFLRVKLDCRWLSQRESGLDRVERTGSLGKGLTFPWYPARFDLSIHPTKHSDWVRVWFFIWPFGYGRVTKAVFKLSIPKKPLSLTNFYCPSPKWSQYMHYKQECYKVIFDYVGLMKSFIYNWSSLLLFCTMQSGCKEQRFITIWLHLLWNKNTPLVWEGV